LRPDTVCTTVLGSVVSSAAGTPHFSAAASMSTRRACAPAMRSGVQYPSVEMLATTYCALKMGW
jgi:hypothetical protein